MAHPVKVATPLSVGSGLALEQFSKAPAGVVIVKVTEELSLVTVLPPRSCTATTGCAGKGVFLVESFGEVVKESFAGGPTVISKESPVAANDPSTACSV